MLVSHGCVIDLGPLPLVLQVEVARLEHLNRAVPLHSHDLERGDLEPVLIVLGVTQSM